MTWLALAPAVLTTAALLFGTGIPAALALRLRGFDAVAVAPGIGAALVAIGAVLAAPLGLRWSWWIPAALALLLAVALGLAGRRWWPDRSLAGWAATARADLPAWLGSALGAGLGLATMRTVLGTPESFSQTFDNIFHLSMTRAIIESGVGSSLLVNGALNSPPTTGFYPAAFHDLTALAAVGDATGLTLGLNGVLVVAVALVWPMGVVFAARTLLSGTPTVLLAAGALSAAFPGFPLLLLEFGVLYPNLLGLALLPPAMGLVGQVLRLAPEERVTPLQGLALGALMLPGLALAHPNVVFALALLAAPWLVIRVAAVALGLVRGASRGWSAWGEIALIVLVLLVFAVAWPRAQPLELPWGPITSHTDAAGHAVLNARPWGAPAWWPSVLLLAGIFAAARRRGGWLVAAWGTVVVFWIVVASFPDGDLRDLMTGIWYNDPHRFYALMPLVALPLAILGAGWLGDGLTSALRALAGDRATRPSGIAAALVPVVVAGGIVGLTQPAGYLDQAREQAAVLYRVTPDSPLVDSDEWALLKRLPQHVGPSDVVATNPWNGSSLAYALTGVHTTTKHIFYDSTPELDLVNAELDEAGRRADEVCPAVRDLRVTHVLDFGTREVHGGHNPYPGLLDMAHQPGFELVDSEGHAALYKVVACD